MNSFEILTVFNMPSTDAIKYLKDKGYKITWDWKDMWKEAHTKSFTVAKVTSLDILQDIREEVDKAVESGMSYKQFEKELIPILKKDGWWGKQIMVSPSGRLEPVWLGTPWRLQTIFNTNSQLAYMAGRYKQMSEVVDTFPYWQYLTVEDTKVRPEHAKLHGIVVRYDDAFWDYYYPPNGYNCRCRVRALTGFTVEEEGLKITTPEIKYVDWENKKTNQIFKIPQGIDPGFDYNPGKAKWVPNYTQYDPDLLAEARIRQ